jgi:hypothetical protein
MENIFVDNFYFHVPMTDGATLRRVARSRRQPSKKHCVGVVVLTTNYLLSTGLRLETEIERCKCKINRKFRVTTEIGSTFFGCWSVTMQLKK